MNSKRLIFAILPISAALLAPIGLLTIWGEAIDENPQQPQAVASQRAGSSSQNGHERPSVNQPSDLSTDSQKTYAFGNQRDIYKFSTDALKSRNPSMKYEAYTGVRECIGFLGNL